MPAALMVIMITTTDDPGEVVQTLAKHVTSSRHHVSYPACRTFHQRFSLIKFLLAICSGRNQARSSCSVARPSPVWSWRRYASSFCTSGRLLRRALGGRNPRMESSLPKHSSRSSASS